MAPYELISRESAILAGLYGEKIEFIVNRIESKFASIWEHLSDVWILGPGNPPKAPLARRRKTRYHLAALGSQYSYFQSAIPRFSTRACLGAGADPSGPDRGLNQLVLITSKLSPQSSYRLVG